MSTVEADLPSTAERALRDEHPRLARERRQATRRRRWLLLLGAAGTVLVGALLAVAAVLVLELDPAGLATGAGVGVDDAGAGTHATSGTATEALGDADTGTAAQAGPDGQQRLLLATVDEDSGATTSITLLTGSSEGAPASVLFVPTGTLAHVPGRGLEQLATAQQHGGSPVLEAAVENVLSVPVDAVAAADGAALAGLFDRGGQLEIELAGRVLERDAAGGAEVRFEQGRQLLDGASLSELWTLHSGDELSVLPRRQMILEQLLTAAGDEVVRNRLVADGAPMLGTDAEPAWMRALFTDLAAAHADEALRFDLLPTERLGQAGPEGQPAFRVQEAETARLVASLFEAPEARAGARPASVVRAQVLNGVGSPGVGQRVDELLPEDVRIVRSGNASTFDHTETRLLVYEEDPAVLAAAERVRDALGAGTIQVSRQPQSIVDLTIVVGADVGSDD